jgi:mRNA-degrading endonuclease toxin of MazEF toxin-antitoxin module
MKKDFKNWHDKKSSIDNIPERPFFHEKEIWFCYLGVNVGFEQDGESLEFLRPVVIIRKFNNQIFWAIPLTKSKKKDSPYYYSFSFISEIRSVAVISQIRLIDARRLSRKIGDISDSDFDNIKQKIKQLIA